MLDKEIIIKRLALIKYLFNIGLDQSRKTEPYNAFSILSFHDSIEMFLKLLAEHKGIKSDKFDFIEYWDKLPALTLKESMRNVNARRVNIKHKGILPSRIDIELSRATAIEFFNQNTLINFGVEFSEISLLSLIIYNKVKNYLEKAQQLSNEHKLKESIENSAYAFDELLYTYENNKAHYYNKSPFYFGKEIKNAFSLHIKDQAVAEFVNSMKDTVDKIRNSTKIISLGIDFKRYVKFSLLTPSIGRFNDKMRIIGFPEEKKWTQSKCQYCINFVIESAMNLQEFDFDIEEIEESRFKKDYLSEKLVELDEDN